MWQTDRTSILTAQKCPRERYYSRHFQGTGIERKTKSLPLIFGAAFHEASEELLLGNGVEAAVARALNYLDEKFAAAGVDLGADELATPEAIQSMTAYSIKEQRAIAEGLVRAWWLMRGERFMAEFDVLEVEKEGRAELAPGVVLMFRPDALVREKASGDLYVISWKTASTFGRYTVNSIATDMQSMSEVWGVLKMYEEERARVANKATLGPMSIEGVLYLFGIKGQRRMDDYLGFKTQDTPLAYAWMRHGPTSEDTEWAWKYRWPSEDGGKQSQLGKGFRKVLVAEHYPGGVKGWVEALAAQEISPRHLNALEAVFPESLPVARRADEIESWRRQTAALEKRLAGALYALEVEGEAGLGTFESRLDEQFPQHTARCFDYQSKCQMFDVCWNLAVKSDPLGSGLYQIRISNHPERGGDDE